MRACADGVELAAARRPPPRRACVWPPRRRAKAGRGRDFEFLMQRSKFCGVVARRASARRPRVASGRSGGRRDARWSDSTSHKMRCVGAEKASRQNASTKCSSEAQQAVKCQLCVRARIAPTRTKGALGTQRNHRCDFSGKTRDEASVVVLAPASSALYLYERERRVGT